MLLVVADGIGESLKAKEHSAEAVRVLVAAFEEKRNMEETFRGIAGNLQTTITAAIIHQNALAVFNFSDSRGYLFQRDGRVIPVTDDQRETRIYRRIMTEGDRLLLCSDGIWRFRDAPIILNSIFNAPGPLLGILTGWVRTTQELLDDSTGN